MTSCVFCDIDEGNVPGKKIYEDDQCFVIRNIRPLAPVHLLVIPHQHIATLDEMNQTDEGLIGHMLYVATKVSQQENLPGYKLGFNVNKEGGQEVFHIHLHVLGGWGTNQEEKI